MIKESKNKNKFSFLILSVLVFSIIMILFYYFSHNSSTSELLKRKAFEMNKSLPIMIDEETRADSVTILDKKTLLFHYTLVHSDKKNLDIQTLENRFLPILIYNLKQSKEFELLKEKGIIFGYTYNDNKKEEIFTFYLTKEMYK